MKMHSCLYRMIPLAVSFGLISTFALMAQNGRLKVKAEPPQAYVFVDGQAMGQAYRPLELSVGNHRIDVVNYGYRPFTKDVSIVTGGTATIDAVLEPSLERVVGPWGCITIENAQRDAIFLNGKTAEFFVGHGDEFNHELGVKQELVVPPGTHQLTIVRHGLEIWSGAVEVPANQRVVVDIPEGVRKTVPWPRGEQLPALSRFSAGTASATVAVAKPTAQISTETQQVSCGEGTRLKWATTEAGKVELTSIGTVSASGEQAVEPKQTTTYELKATGPGGTATDSKTVGVNASIKAQLALSPSEVRYRRVGEKTLEEPNSALNWSVANATSVSIEPFGAVDPNGNRDLQISPQQTTPGKVDETVTYTLTASNVCGATETQTATLHITGDIEAERVVRMQSVYFSTDRPRPESLAEGLVASQKQMLSKLAQDFKAYLEVHPDAQLILAGHADQRGAKRYNQSLSERRAEAAKSFLIEHGIPAEKIQTQAYGEESNLSRAEVKDLLTTHPEASEMVRAQAVRNLTTMVYAHNRRVDMELTTTGQKSARHYPFGVEEFSELVQRGPKVPATTNGSKKRGM